MKKMRHQILLNALYNKAYDDYQSLKELADFVESALQKEHRRRLAAAEKKIATVTDEYEQAFLAQCYSEEVFQVERDFPRIQRYALFVSSISMIEAAVVSMVRTSRTIFKVGEVFDERAPSVIARGMNFLERNIGINISKFRSALTLAENLVRVRNCIAHAAGDLKSRKEDEVERIRSFLENMPTADIDRFDHIILHHGFVENTSHAMHQMVQRIMESMKLKLRDQQTVSEGQAAAL